MFQVPVLANWIYRENTSLRNDLTELCEKEAAVDASALANLCYKFLICYILENPSHLDRNISEDETIFLYHKALAIVNKKSDTWLKQETEKRIWKCRYQLEMIMDIPSTMEITDEVIRLVESIEWQDFVWWDLWAGSGILMPAQHIGAKKSGKQNLEITGFELSEWAIQRGNPILTSLWIGSIVSWSTTRKRTYQWRSVPRFISSESLPTSWVPFHAVNKDTNRWELEPFIENIDALIEVFGEDTIRRTLFFPSGLEWWNIKDKVTMKNKSSELFWLGKMKLLAHLGKKDTSNYIFPTWIPINGVWKRIDEMGTRYRDVMNLWRHLYPHRWSRISQEDLWWIYLKA